MSDEFLFDSERQQRKAEKKRLLIPLLVLVGIILAVIVVTLILRSGRPETHVEGEDGPYPYSWQINKDGSLQLSISHEDAPEYEWILDNREEQQLLLAQDRKDKSGSTRFTFTPEATGRVMLDLWLQREIPGQRQAGDPAEEEEYSSKDEMEEALATQEPKNRSIPQDALDCIYHMQLLVDIEQDPEQGWQPRPISAHGVVLQGRVTGGEDQSNPYSIYSDKQHRFVAAVQIQARERDWNYEILSGQDCLSSLDFSYSSGEVRLSMLGGSAAGESEILLRSQLAGMELHLSCQTLEDGTLLLKEHQANYSEKAADDPEASTESTEFEPAAANASAEGDHEHEDEEGQQAVTESPVETVTEASDAAETAETAP